MSYNPNIHTIGTGPTQTLALSAQSQLESSRHANILLNMEAAKVARTLIIPTLPEEVKDKLRQFGEPVRLFGEGLGDVRERLKMIMGRKKVLENQGGGVYNPNAMQVDGQNLPLPAQGQVQVQVEELAYTPALQQLITAREFIATYSIDRSIMRLNKERERRSHTRVKLDDSITSSSSQIVTDETPPSLITGGLAAEESHAAHLYATTKKIALDVSEYGDDRPLTAVVFAPNDSSGAVNNDNVLTCAGWSGVLKVYGKNMSSGGFIEKRCLKGHMDRVTSIAYKPNTANTIASASIDCTARIWDINSGGSTELKGHSKRLSNIVFHPSGNYVGTTSFDYTWRLWDVNTSQQLLLQDGHYSESYGISFHPDGSLVSTTDFAGVVQVWDLRSGKSISHFQGHAKRVLCVDFSGNGFQLCTGGDDGCIKIWDLRQRKMLDSIPAHSALITQLKYSKSSEMLVSSSFDGCCKMWETRGYRELGCLVGHEGKVMGCDVNEDESVIVSAGFDKTFKVWR